MDGTKQSILSELVNKNQGIENAGKALGIGNDGIVTPVPFSGTDFTGATASSAGVHGYVPAPAAGDQNKVLKGDGTWSNVEALPVVTSSDNGKFLYVVNGAWVAIDPYEVILTRLVDRTIESFENNFVKTVRSYALYGCASLIDVFLPSATSIGVCAFRGCSSLTDISLPLATSIGSYAFRDCSSLTDISLPLATSIGSNAFRGCESLTTVILEADQVCSLEDSSNIPSEATFYVPDDLVSSYESATNWSNIANQIKGISELPT